MIERGRKKGYKQALLSTSSFSEKEWEDDARGSVSTAQHLLQPQQNSRMDVPSYHALEKW